MNQYKWTFPALEAYPQHEGATDVVFTVHYRLDGDDGLGHTAGVYGTVGVTYEGGSSFTPFAELTPEIVTGWVEAALGEEQVTAMKANIDSQIADQINPPVVVLPPPWAVALGPIPVEESAPAEEVAPA